MIQSAKRVAEALIVASVYLVLIFVQSNPLPPPLGPRRAVIYESSNQRNDES